MGEIKKVHGRNLARGDFIEAYGNDNYLAKFEQADSSVFAIYRQK